MASRSSYTVQFKHKKKESKDRNQKHTHPVFMLMLSIIILSKIQTLSSKPNRNSDPQTLSSYQYSANLNHTHYHQSNVTIAAVRAIINIYQCKTRKGSKSFGRWNSKALIIMLLLSAGDIHPNPGPRDTSPTRYKLLESIVEKLSPKKFQNNITHSNRIGEQEDLNFLQELPTISSKDYIGVDMCRSCYKEVKEKQPAVLCDQCETWIHLRCSDMTRKIYNIHKTEITFNWICNICRSDEEEIHERINENTLKGNQIPETFDAIQTRKNELLIIHLNARSIVNKSDDFHQYCQTLKPDIICVTETWFDDSVPKQSYAPPGYKVIRKDRCEDFKQMHGKNKGGGIAVYYKQEIKVEKKNLFEDEVDEILWVKVKTNSKQSFLLGTIYRAEYAKILDDKESESKLEMHIQKAIEQSDKVIITGDLNADVTKDSCCKHAVMLKRVCKSYGLTQYVQKPTRIDNRSRKATIIDHIWADKEKNIINKCGTLMGLSDHLAIYMKLNIQSQKQPEATVRCRSYKTYNAENFCNEMSENLNRSNIQHNISRKNVNEAMNEFLEVFQATAEKHAPTKEITIRKENSDIPWFTPELKDKIKLKNSVLKDWYVYGLQEDKQTLKLLKNQINHLKLKLKKKYYTEKFRLYEGDTKKTWKTLQEVTRITTVKESSEPDDMTKEKANKFNKYFANVGTEIQKKLKIMQHRTDFTGLTGFNFIQETEENIEKLIDRIRPDVAVGYDNLSAKLIKDAKKTITPWITKIINLGYEVQCFPDCMKVTNIKPLHKKDDTDKISNYRPISILPTLSKIFERSATDQLVSYLEQKNLINPNQHAYRKGHSTQTCLVELANLLYANNDNRKYTGIASLDLSKAYDSISHTLLLHKLAKLGLAEGSIKWIGSYLCNRRQRTKFQKYISDEETITSGIPQGSIIGPILFICFTNDLAEVFKNVCTMIAYADDTQLVIDAKNIKQLQQKIENIIKLAQEWYENNSMKNNIGKTEILIMSKGNIFTEITIEVIDEGHPVTIKSKKSIKLLGVIIDCKLDWIKQINNVKRKALNVIRNLHRIRHIIPVTQKIQLYNALVTPHFTYADVVWGGCGKTNSRRLQTAQNFALRTIMNRKKSDSATEILQELKFLNLSEKRQIHEAVFINKAMQFKLSKNITEEYMKYQPTSDTRYAESGKLTVPKHRTAKFENSPLYRTMKTWNQIPDHIAKENLPAFKNQYQKYLIQQKHTN